MSFVFASSHLPEVKRPEDDEEEEDVQPMQRSGMVRAFSHLPQPVRGESSAPRLSSPAPASRPAWATAPEAPAGHEADEGHDAEPDDDADDGHGSSSSADTGAHEPDDGRPWYQPRITAADLQPEGEDHDPDPGFSIPPENPVRDSNPDPGFYIHPSKAWGKPTPDAGFGSTPQDIRDDPRSPAPDTTAAAPAPRSAALPYGRLFEKRPTPGFSAPNGRPEFNDLVHRTQGESPPKPGFNDPVYRFNGSPEEAREDARSFSQNVADVYGSSPPLAAKGGDLSQAESPRPAGNPAPPSSSQEKFQQSSPQTPTASPDKTTPQQPVQNVESPYEELRDYLKKSKNPLFIKDYYDHRTPLEEKLRLRQLILSLRAPAGEKLPLYIQHLQHWFNAKNRPPVDQDGKEEPVTHPLKELMQWPVVPEAYHKVLDRFGSLPDGKLDHKTIFDWVRAHPDATKPGGVAVPDTYWDVPVDGSHPDPVKKLFGLPKPGNEGYFYAFGGAPMTAKSSGVRGIVDKNGGVRFRGNFNVRLHDRYDWNLGQGTPLRPDPRIPMDKIRQYIPKDIPVISPKGDEIQVSDSFFKEMLEKGYGRDFDVEAPKEPVTLEYYQAKPGGPFQIREIPRTP